jgi:hypothetical protein
MALWHRGYTRRHPSARPAQPLGSADPKFAQLWLVAVRFMLPARPKMPDSPFLSRRITPFS